MSASSPFPSSSSPPQLDSLSPEIVRTITHHLPNRDLKNLRLANKTLNSIAVESLFGTIFLHPTKDAISKWNSILDDESHLCKVPHHAIIHSRRAIDWNGSDGLDDELEEEDEEEDGDGDNENDDQEETQSDDDPGEKRRAAFANAISRVANMSRLRSLEIGFTPRCVGLANADPYNPFEIESFENRLEFLRNVFHNLSILIQKTATTSTTSREDGDEREEEEKDVAPPSPSLSPSPFRSLTIQNLQNCPLPPSFTSSPFFPSVLNQLEELHIGMVTEFNEHGDDYDHECIELRTFAPHLISEWFSLSPRHQISQNLKSLSLYDAKENWGPLPGQWDFSGVSFPNLKTLALGYYTLAHDGQMDWVLRQKSLRKLVLDNCMILSDMRFYAGNVDEWQLLPTTTGRGNDWEEVVYDDDLVVTQNDYDHDHDHDFDRANPCFRYHGKWSQFFDKITDGLPGLEEFCFDYRRSSIYYSANNKNKNSEKENTYYSVINPPSSSSSSSTGDKNKSAARLHPQRYVHYNLGRWIEAHSKRNRGDGDDGAFRGHRSFWEGMGRPDMIRNLHQENFAEDQESLDRLLERCGERRRARIAASAT